MSKTVESAVNQIKEIVLSAAAKGVSGGSLPAEPMPAFQIEIPADRTHGDYAVNAAMVSARAFHKAPRAIAEILVSNMDFTGTLIKSAEIAGPGFINFFLSDAFYGGVLKEIEQEKENYGKSDFGKGKKVNVEFVSANPTGPMHIGNARGGALGDCLAAVLGAAGYSVSKEFYINDAGNQIAKFALSLEARYLQIYCDDILFPEDGYHGADITERAKQFAEIHGDKYINADPESRQNALVDFALPLNIQELKDDLMRYRIEYNTWFSELTLHNSGAVKEIIDILKNKGLLYEKEGALWYKATEFSGEKDEVLIRANGNPTYFAADIAYHYNKLETRGFDKAINVWGADHHGHVTRLKGALDAIGLDGNRLDIVLMQMVRLVRNGELVKVSKRTGKSITLKTLLEEVPLDAARFFFNMREPNTHLEFDLDLAVAEDSKNPVYYVQYAHARICSLLKKLTTEGIVFSDPDLSELHVLNTTEERDLIRHLAGFSNEIILSAKEYNPAGLTRYAITLATLFHKFYNACPVKTASPELLQPRTLLAICTRTVLQNALALLKITAPEEM